MLKQPRQAPDTNSIARLRQLGIEATNLADELAERRVPMSSATGSESSASVRVRRYLRQRRQRDKAFPAGTFADPAWDIMLDLYASDLEGRKVSVSDACLASSVPPTTALRWIKHLESQGNIHRYPSGDDRRRFYLTLSIESYQSIAEWVAATFGADPVLQR